MVFSSGIFLFQFLPIFFIGYYLLPTIRLRNLWALVASLYFYGYGEPLFVALMGVSILVNYLFGLGIYAFRDSKVRMKGVWIGSLLFNFTLLFIFKYLDFFVETANALLHLQWKAPGIPLPIGISFFTFQAYSYVYDVYIQEDRQAYLQRNPLDLGLYISMFPQLIAGPIVRYRDIASQIRSRRLRVSATAGGIRRFLIGLSKKLLLANAMGRISADVFAEPPSEAGALFLLLGALSYSFQIYYDFSGYSDMAIGLGRMMGFSFRENFDYPYRALSVTDFWRRWHISLSRWFRDYLYIPLGGSRKGEGRRIRNLLIVWTFTGLWHGANWTFVLWGLWYFCFLTAEKLLQKKLGKPIEEVLPSFLTYLYTMSVVLIGWVLFNSPSAASALAYLRGMLDFSGRGLFPGRAAFYLLNFRWEYLACAVFATDIPRKLLARRTEKLRGTRAFGILETAVYGGLFYLCILYIMKGSYNPFIYFNF